MASVERLEHDEAVEGVEGEAEGAQGVAAEDDGRALLGLKEEVGRDAAQFERADVNRRGADAAREHAASGEVARAPLAALFGDDDAEGPGRRAVNREAEAGARVEERAAPFGELDEGAPASALAQPAD